jgi:hypothetical protein
LPAFTCPAEHVPQYRRYLPCEPDPKHNIPKLVGKAAAEQHWPAPGEKVTYLVYVKNAGFARSEKTDFVCTIGGKVVKTAKIPALVPKQEMQVEVTWNWKQGPYEFTAKADTRNKMCEISKKNNTLSFKTDAYALVAVCEKGIVEPIEQVNNWYGSFCFEDWVLHANPFGYPDVVGRNGLFLIRAQVNGSWYYAFIDIGRFVVEYARGHKDSATYPIDLKAENQQKV